MFTDLYQTLFDNCLRYVPKFNDKMDIALADAINKNVHRDKIRYMFLYLEEGTYQFGKKLIQTKIERGNVYVKAGSGYLKFNEFADKNLNIEFKKIETRGLVEVFYNMFAQQ